MKLSFFRQLTISPFILDNGWVLGVGVALLQITTYAMWIGEPRDWMQYYLMAALAGLAIISGIISAPSSLHKTLKWLKVAFTIYGIAGICVYLMMFIYLSYLDNYGAFLFLWTMVMMAAITTHIWLRQGLLQPSTSELMKASGLTLFVLWAFIACASVVYYLPTPLILTDKLASWYLARAISEVVYIGCFLLAYHFVFRPVVQKVPVLVNVLAHAVALGVMFVFYFRTDISSFFSDTGYYGQGMFALIQVNWKALFEPSIAVRAGGWLLWDVPSLYGFFQTLLIAFLPGEIWQSFYILNSSLMLLCGYLIFRTLFAYSNNVIGYIFSLLLTLSCTSWLQTVSIIDHRLYPQAGPIRFLWLYALVSYVLLLYRRFAHKDVPLPRWCYHVGTLLWLLGSLWSCESCVYMCILWIPACAILACAEKPYLSLRNVCESLGVSVILCVIYGVVAAILIAGWYHLRLGHYPDLELFSAFALAYKDGIMALPIGYYGAVACLTFVFFMQVIITKIYVGNMAWNRCGLHAAALLYVTLAAIWSASSYYISRSHDQNILSIIPVIVYMVAIVLWLLPRLGLPVFFQNIYRLGMACFFAIILFPSSEMLMDGRIYNYMLTHPVVEYDITRLRNNPDPAAQSIAKTILSSGDAHVLLLDDGFAFQSGQFFTPWLLPNTVISYTVLPAATEGKIVKRRAERSCSDGWIVENINDPVSSLSSYPWLPDAIAAYYHEVSSTQISKWRIHHYQKSVPPFC